MSLIEFLESQGYRRVPLARNGVGHFETAEHSPVELSACIPATSALHHGPQPGKRGPGLEKGGAGGCNSRVDVFEKQAAIIDYGSSSLCLREAHDAGKI